MLKYGFGIPAQNAWFFAWREENFTALISILGAMEAWIAYLMKCARLVSWHYWTFQDISVISFYTENGSLVEWGEKRFILFVNAKIVKIFGKTLSKLYGCETGPGGMWEWPYN